MSPWLAVPLLLAGVGLVVASAGRLVAGAIGTARGLGVSAFFVSVVFIGFDPENLAVGAVAGAEGVAGIALGAILGAAMVAVALAFGLTALLAPMRFEGAPKDLLSLPLVAVLLFAALTLDGRLTRVDGGILLAAYVAVVGYLLYRTRSGGAVSSPGGEGREAAERLGPWKAAGLLALSLAGIILGSELVVLGSKEVLDRIGIAETAYGMTILAFLVSVEEVARELPAALKGHAEISLGNVVGSVFAFFLMNAGAIALVAPLAVGPEVLAFHLPVAAFTVALVSLMVMRGGVPRWGGGLLLLCYAAFVAGSFLVGSEAPLSP